MLNIDFVATKLNVSRKCIERYINKASLRPYKFSRNGMVDIYLNGDMISIISRLIDKDNSKKQ